MKTANKTAKKPMIPSAKEFIAPVLQTLRNMGGRARKHEVVTRIVEEGKYTKGQLCQTDGLGRSVLVNNIQWARAILVREEYVVAARGGNWGWWELTEKGTQADPDPVAQQLGGRGKKESEPPEEQLDAELIRRLRGMSPFGFELFCGRLLREVGFEDVVVTKHTRDGGIDGKAFFVANPFISTAFVFQCKRYNKDALVGPDVVRALRGVIAEGVSEKGAVITTSQFTKAARAAAIKESPIALIDGGDLAGLMKEKLLGVKRTESQGVDGKEEKFQINEDFFAQFDKDGKGAARKAAK